MTTKVFRKVAFLVLTIVLAGSTVFAQGWRNGNRAGFGRYGNWTADSLRFGCVNVIQGLTEDQKSEISKLNKDHRETMAQLREKRRSTFDAIEKNEIRGEMLKAVKAHREEVRKVLTEEQQEELDLLQARNRGWRQGYAQGRRDARPRAGFTGRNRNRCGNFPGGRYGRMGNRRMNIQRGGCYFYNN